MQSWRKIDVICGLSVCVSVFPESLLRVLTKGAQCTQIIIIMFFLTFFFSVFFFFSAVILRQCSDHLCQRTTPSRLVDVLQSKLLSAPTPA